MFIGLRIVNVSQAFSCEVPGAELSWKNAQGVSISQGTPCWI